MRVIQVKGIGGIWYPRIIIRWKNRKLDIIYIQTIQIQPRIPPENFTDLWYRIFSDGAPLLPIKILKFIGSFIIFRIKNFKSKINITAQFRRSRVNGNLGRIIIIQMEGDHIRAPILPAVRWHGQNLDAVINTIQGQFAVPIPVITIGVWQDTVYGIKGIPLIITNNSIMQYQVKTVKRRILDTVGQGNILGLLPTQSEQIHTVDMGIIHI